MANFVLWSCTEQIAEPIQLFLFTIWFLEELNNKWKHVYQLITGMEEIDTSKEGRRINR